MNEKYKLMIVDDHELYIPLRLIKQTRMEKVKAYLADPENDIVELVIAAVGMIGVLLFFTGKLG
jgi:hypothetical protein